jgi:DNA polymerase III gamma/tau subunit
MLVDIAKKEGFELDAGSAELLAILASGSFRDALGELQKVLNFSKNKKIKREDVEKITGAPKSILVNDFISAIASKDLPKGIATVRKASEANLDMRLYFKLIIEKFRMAIIFRYAPKIQNEMAGDLSETDLEFLTTLVKGDTEGMLRSPALSVLLDAYQNIDNAFIADLPLELALVKIISKE